MPPETLVNLGLVYGPVVAAFGFASVWCYTHYRLTRERHAEILEELGKRRLGAPVTMKSPRLSPAIRRALLVEVTSIDERAAYPLALVFAGAPHGTAYLFVRCAEERAAG